MNSLFSAKKLLVIVDGNLKPGDYIAYTVLLDVLRKNTQSIDVIHSKDFGESLTKIVHAPEVKKITEIAPKRLIMSFDKREEQVKNIQWHQTDQKINIYVSMENGKFNPAGMKVTSEGGDYDTILYYGIKDFQQVQAKFNTFPSLINSAKNISFGWTFAIPHSKVELVRKEQGQTVAELVYQNCQGKEMTPEHYTRLLAAILSSTSRFKGQGVTGKTFTICADLLSKGADISRANSLVDRTSVSKSPSKPKPVGKPAPKKLPERDPLPKVKVPAKTTNHIDITSKPKSINESASK